jgi:hypothetical protein
VRGLLLGVSVRVRVGGRRALQTGRIFCARGGGFCACDECDFFTLFFPFDLVVDATADGDACEDSRSRRELSRVKPDVRGALFRHGRRLAVLLVLRSDALRRDEKLQKSRFGE